jgi:hypothetical protein
LRPKYEIKEQFKELWVIGLEKDKPSIKLKDLSTLMEDVDLILDLEKQYLSTFKKEKK